MGDIRSASLPRDRDLGNLGVVTRGDTIESLSAPFADAGTSLVEWYGVRVLTDHLTNVPPPANIDEILDLEWKVGRRDRYRWVARLLHVIDSR